MRIAPVNAEAVVLWGIPGRRFEHHLGAVFELPTISLKESPDFTLDPFQFAAVSIDAVQGPEIWDAQVPMASGEAQAALGAEKPK